METYKRKKNETRKEFLVRIAVDYIRSHSGYIGVDDEIKYDGAECDGECLANDLEIEFNIQE